ILSTASLFSFMRRHPPVSPSFPYPTLFRSGREAHRPPAIGSRGQVGHQLVEIVLCLADHPARVRLLRRLLRHAQRRGRLVERTRSEEHTSELQSRGQLVVRLLLEKKKGHAA